MEVVNSETEQSAGLLSRLLPSSRLAMHPAGTFEDEGCRFMKVHGDPLKH